MAGATSFGTACILRRAAQTFAVSHSHIFNSNATFSFQTKFSSHILSVSTCSGLYLFFQFEFPFIY